MAGRCDSERVTQAREPVTRPPADPAVGRRTSAPLRAPRRDACWERRAWPPAHGCGVGGRRAAAARYDPTRPDPTRRRRAAAAEARAVHDAAGGRPQGRARSGRQRGWPRLRPVPPCLTGGASSGRPKAPRCRRAGPGREATQRCGLRVAAGLQGASEAVKGGGKGRAGRTRGQRARVSACRGGKSGGKAALVAGSGETSWVFAV